MIQYSKCLASTPFSDFEFDAHHSYLGQLCATSLVLDRLPTRAEFEEIPMKSYLRDVPKLIWKNIPSSVRRWIGPYSSCDTARK
ncbi:hypothetical protein Naga_100878g4 [Nannochloropsis gaditana]|uniref:Uncharacterized protein n=1 Tax=Nannochloropsis gaditana TaxID=72520 RepID=W7UBI3_9STRA|nr:hypothetical protein Naga_100878g4 [Nannochloropsis gaditana]